MLNTIYAKPNASTIRNPTINDFLYDLSDAGKLLNSRLLLIFATMALYDAAWDDLEL